MGHKSHLLRYAIVGLWLCAFAAHAENAMLFHPDASLFDALVMERQGLAEQIPVQMPPQVSPQTSSQVLPDADVPMAQDQSQTAPEPVMNPRFDGMSYLPVDAPMLVEDKYRLESEKRPHMGDGMYLGLSQGVAKASTSHLQYAGVNPRSFGAVSDSYSAAWLSGLQGGYRFMTSNGIFFSATLGLDIDNTTVTKTFKHTATYGAGTVLPTTATIPANNLPNDAVFPAGTVLRGSATMRTAGNNNGTDYLVAVGAHPIPPVANSANIVLNPYLDTGTTLADPNGGALGQFTFQNYLGDQGAGLLTVTNTVGNQTSLMVPGQGYPANYAGGHWCNGESEYGPNMPVGGAYVGPAGGANDVIILNPGQAGFVVPANQWFVAIRNTTGGNLGAQQVDLGYFTPAAIANPAYIPFDVITPATGTQIATGAVSMAAGSAIPDTSLPGGAVVPPGLTAYAPITYRTKLKRNYSVNMLMQIGKQFSSGFAPYITAGVTHSSFSAKIVACDSVGTTLQTVSKKKMDRQALALGIGSYYALTPKDSLGVQYLHQQYRQGAPFRDSSMATSIQIPKNYQTFTLNYTRRLSGE